MCSKVKLRAKKVYRTRKEAWPRIHASKTRNPGLIEDFEYALEESLPTDTNASACKRWEHFRDAVYSAAISIFGKKTSKSAYWFEAHSEKMVPVIEEKRKAHAAYKASPSERHLQALRAARNKVQMSARRCANDYWLQLCSQIQLAADTGNVKGMYEYCH